MVSRNANRRLFRVGPITLAFSGSGDKLIDWVQAGTLLLIALIATAVWSFVSRSSSHPRAYQWFRLLLRFAVGATMMRYGLGKVIPLQMPTLFLTRLVEPFGNFSRMGVLWTSIGAAPAYESFVGAVELAGGPRSGHSARISGRRTMAHPGVRTVRQRAPRLPCARPCHRTGDVARAGRGSGQRATGQDLPAPE
jgi:hypothetical protein